MNRRSLIVNAITFARVPLIVAWAILAVIHEYRGGWPLAAVATLMLVLSGLTDLWDGRLARRWQVVSTLGKMADPLMDKVFYLVAFPTLVWQIAHQGENEFHALIMLAFTVLYLARDTWVTFMRSVGTMFGADVSAMWLGKVRTALSFPGAGWIYLYLAFSRGAPEAVRFWWLGSCYLFEAVLIALTLWSLVTYTRSYSPYLVKAMGRH